MITDALRKITWMKILNDRQIIEKSLCFWKLIPSLLLRSIHKIYLSINPQKNVFLIPKFNLF